MVKQETHNDTTPAKAAKDVKIKVEQVSIIKAPASSPPPPLPLEVPAALHEFATKVFNLASAEKFVRDSDTGKLFECYWRNADLDFLKRFLQRRISEETRTGTLHAHNWAAEALPSPPSKRPVPLVPVVEEGSITCTKCRRFFSKECLKDIPDMSVEQCTCKGCKKLLCLWCIDDGDFCRSSRTEGGPRCSDCGERCWKCNRVLVGVELRCEWGLHGLHYDYDGECPFCDYGEPICKICGWWHCQLCDNPCPYDPHRGMTKEQFAIVAAAEAARDAAHAAAAAASAIKVTHDAIKSKAAAAKRPVLPKVFSKSKCRQCKELLQKHEVRCCEECFGEECGAVNKCAKCSKGSIACANCFKFYGKKCAKDLGMMSVPKCTCKRCKQVFCNECLGEEFHSWRRDKVEDIFCNECQYHCEKCDKRGKDRELWCDCNEDHDITCWFCDMHCNICGGQHCDFCENACRKDSMTKEEYEFKEEKKRIRKEKELERERELKKEQQAAAKAAKAAKAAAVAEAAARWKKKNISIPYSKVGSVIGKRGATISSIQARTGTTLQLLDNPEGKTLAISADSMDAEARILAAEAEIASILARPPRAAPTLSVSAIPSAAVAAARVDVKYVVPFEKVGRVIGKGGVTVKELISRYGVKIVIPHTADANAFPPVGTLVVSGFRDAALCAIKEIKNIIEDDHRGGGKTEVTRTGAGTGTGTGTGI